MQTRSYHSCNAVYASSTRLVLRVWRDYVISSRQISLIHDSIMTEKLSPLLAPLWGETTVEVMTWMDNYMPHKTMGVITFPRPHLREPMPVKGVPWLLQSTCWYIDTGCQQMPCWLYMFFSWAFHESFYWLNDFDSDKQISWNPSTFKNWYW